MFSLISCEKWSLNNQCTFSEVYSLSPLLSWASTSDGPVSAGGSLGVGPGAASGDREPPPAPVPEKLPPIPVTDTSTANWEYADTTQRKSKRWTDKRNDWGCQEGDAGWKNVHTESSGTPQQMGGEKDELTRGAQRTGQHQLLSDFQLLFHSSVWL